MTTSTYSADVIIQSASPVGENEEEIENQQLVKKNETALNEMLE